MLRPDGQRNAKTLVTLHGSLEDFNVPKTSVGDFIMIDEQPKNVSWDYKHVRSIDFDGPMEKAGLSVVPFRFVGNLRSLYAQEIQANLLNQLGRVGVSVPPALAFAASIKLFHRTKNGTPQELTLDDPAVTKCYFVPGRQSNQQGKAVFTHKFVQNLMAAIGKVDKKTISPEDAAALEKLLSPKIQQSIVNATYAGVSLEAPICEGIFLTTKPKHSKCPLWVEMTISIPTSISQNGTNLPIVVEESDDTAKEDAIGSKAEDANEELQEAQTAAKQLHPNPVKEDSEANKEA